MRNSGFTLIDLMIVISIIGILAAVDLYFLYQDWKNQKLSGENSPNIIKMDSISDITKEERFAQLLVEKHRIEKEIERLSKLEKLVK